MEIVKLEIKDLNLIQTLAHKTWQETYTTILSKDQLEFMLEEIYSLKSLKAQIIEGQEFYGFSFENQIVG
jgi:diamine N-acetyltransferase